MKILINTPNWRNPKRGGVNSHFYGLRPYWTEDVRYNIIGRRNGAKGRGKYWLPWDIVKTIAKILAYRPDIFMVNPSLGKTALFRDSIFVNIAHSLGRKVVVHMHGFDVDYAKELDVQKFVKQFNRADAFIVLSSPIKKQLEEWGITKPIYLSTTKVDDRLVEGYDNSKRDGKIKRILYLGRVEKAKGIFISIDIYALLQQKYPDLEYRVVGEGSDLENAKRYAKEKDVKNIVFTGVLTSNDLKEQFVGSDLYLFTSYHEGMPTSVLEAMCFGLPIVTRPVGGLVDFFENGEMGQMVDSFDATDFIEPIEDLMSNQEKAKRISDYNYQYGRDHFLASNVAVKIQNILKQI